MVGFEYPEDMSEALLSLVWHKIHDQPLELEARALCTKAWNLEAQRLRRVAPFGSQISTPSFSCGDDQAVQESREHWAAESSP